MGEHGQYRALVRHARAACLAAWLGLAGGAAAQECRIALSLGLDVSNSVDVAEYRFQTTGLAAALVARDVVTAFFSDPNRVVALHIFEWSGSWQQAVRQDWITITSRADLEAVAGRLSTMERSFSTQRTALGHAMRFGAAALEQRPDCAAWKLDISGDGQNNLGLEPERALPRAGGRVTVNGLVIGGQDLIRYYEEHVIRGPGAFVEQTWSHADFERAMRRKLVRELTAFQVSGAEPGEVSIARRGASR